MILEIVEAKILQALPNEIVYINSFNGVPQDNITTIYHAGGQDPEMILGDIHTYFHNLYFQVRVRDINYSDAFDRLEIIADALIGTNMSDSRYNIISILQRGDLLSLGQDDKKRTELVMNFEIKYQNIRG